MASSSADTTRKKLKYVKYSPKSVAPDEASIARRRTGEIVIPIACGCSDWRRSSPIRSANTAASPKLETFIRIDVALPYRVFHSSRPRSNAMKAFGVVR